MYLCIADQRANPQEPEELRRVLDDAGYFAGVTTNGNVWVNIHRADDLITISRWLDAVIEAWVDVDGCDVGTQIRLKDRERSE